jgi:hypothetical protein
MQDHVRARQRRRVDATPIAFPPHSSDGRACWMVGGPLPSPGMREEYRQVEDLHPEGRPPDLVSHVDLPGMQGCRRRERNRLRW